jgi:hypothetical protein
MKDAFDALSSMSQLRHLTIATHGLTDCDGRAPEEMAAAAGCAAKSLQALLHSKSLLSLSTCQLRVEENVLSLDLHRAEAALQCDTQVALLQTTAPAVCLV